MKDLPKYFAALAYIVLFLPFGPFAQDATAILEKSDKKLRGKTSRAEMRIKVLRPDWERTMELKTWTKGTEYAMILITAPAKEEGTAFLKRNDEIWNWVPRVERTIKLPPSMMMQSWMGTDFTNDDLVEQSNLVTDYHHEHVGDSTIRGRSCHKLKLTPKKDAAVVWGKILLWIDKEEHMQLLTKFYDEKGELVNIMKGRKVKELGGRTLPSELVMIPNDEEGHRTIMTYKSMSFNEPIEDNFFTTRKMKSLR